MTEQEVENLWDLLSNVPFDESENDLEIGEYFYIWDAGTSRDEIWHWFDENHPRGIYWLLYERDV